MGDNARIAQCRSLEGVLVGEGRPEQQASVVGEGAFRIEAFGKLVGVPAEGIRQIAVALFESG